MSASNWAVCPRCLERARVARDDAFQHALSLYGVVPLDEFESARTEAEAVAVSADAFQTFREDYEIYGASEGTVKVSYSGHCQTCHLGFDFTDERTFYDLSSGAADSQSETQ